MKPIVKNPTRVHLLDPGHAHPLPPLPFSQSYKLDRSPAATCPMTTNTLVTVCDKVPAIRQPYEIDSQDNVSILQSLPSYLTWQQFDTGPSFSSHCLQVLQTVPLSTFLKTRQHVNSLHTAVILPFQQRGGCHLPLLEVWRITR